MSDRYVFGEFVLSASRRVLHRSGREIALVPRYFDLLLLLIRRRHEAISRSAILDTVWSDVVVSDGALSQAVRTLRRALGDDPAQSKYIRTVSRFGYQFVFPDVAESDDAAPLPNAGPSSAGTAPAAKDFEAVFDELASEAPETERRLAAEALHRLGTEKAVARLRDAPRGPEARALLRDARWDMPQAGSVPIFGQPRALRTLWELFLLRLRGVRRAAGRRYAAAVAGAAFAGLLAGAAGGLALYLGPASPATGAVFVLLPLIGGAIGAAGAAGVAAGLCCAEVLVRSHRGAALVVFGATGGGAVGAAGHGLGSIVLQAIFGQDLSPIAGGLEGVVIGAATGLGYALAVPLPGGGMATPRGAARARAVLAAGVACAVATAILTACGSYLGAMSLDLLAQRFPGSQVSLAPLARLLGEPAPGPTTRIAIGAWEGMMFASGTLLGLTHRPQ
jgi:DNA-binding winged helix-turn-helix (wHTH) protein